ncbi:MAG: sugar transferase [Chloroflexi bacterium HGW-Chloroflexi-10]|nr:MAG: sugar transferase [Chloroflexi bacterium HGW-Chloroflexi-10]
MDSLIKTKGITNTAEQHSKRVVVPVRFQWALFYVLLVVADCSMIGTAMRFAYWVRFKVNLPFFVDDAFSSPEYYENLVIFIIPAWLTIFFLHGLYREKYLLGGVVEYDRLFYANTIAVLVIVALGFFEPTFIFARGWIFISWLSVFIFTAFGRFWVRRLVYGLRSRGWYLSNTLIIGINDEATTMAEQLQYVTKSGMNLIGFVDYSIPAGTNIFKNLNCLGGLQDLSNITRQYNIEEIILTSTALRRNQILDIYRQYGVSKKTKLRMSSGVYELMTTGLEVKEFAWVPLVEVNKVRLTGMNSVLKLIMDYGITIPGLLVISPILLIIAIAIKISSPGPIIHRRRVMGVNGKTFDAFKFRSMVTNGDEILEKYPEKLEELRTTHKIKDDPRITPIGAFLRKTSLDELPQLFNVLRNEMSLVGPRMISPEEVQDYQKWGINLLTVKPGITGKWQISGRSEISYQQRVQIDMYYIRNWNIWLDIQILLQTLPAVLSKRGAY